MNSSNFAQVQPPPYDTPLGHRSPPVTIHGEMPIIQPIATQQPGKK